MPRQNVHNAEGPCRVEVVMRLVLMLSAEKIPDGDSKQGRSLSIHVALSVASVAGAHARVINGASSLLAGESEV